MCPRAPSAAASSPAALDDLISEPVLDAERGRIVHHPAVAP
ncbi:hypothetical protein ACWGI0_17140 [Streptomyces sp. NPDC054802]